MQSILQLYGGNMGCFPFASSSFRLSIAMGVLVGNVVEAV